MTTATNPTRSNSLTEVATLKGGFFFAGIATGMLTVWISFLWVPAALRSALTSFAG